MLLALSGVRFPFFITPAAAILAVSFSVIQLNQKKALLFMSCCLYHFDGGLPPWAPQNIFTLSGVLLREKNREGGRSVQIHTTWSTATLQNRRCSSVALPLFLVLQACCPPCNSFLVSELPGSFRFAIWGCAYSWNMQRRYRLRN